MTRLDTAARSRWAVVGGGMLGLTLALRLAQHGHRVTVLERAPAVGGLAAAWTIDTPGGPVTWDRHYHVTLLSDSAVRSVLRELGLEHEMQWVVTRTGYYADGVMSSVSDTLEFLRLPGLSPAAKLRLGATIFYGSKVRNWTRLERVPVGRWLSRWSGRATFERFWLPLLRAKLGESWHDANAAFIWATIQRLYAARRSGLKHEMFGYVPGGYARILERFAQRLAELGVEIRTGAAVERVRRRDGGGIEIALAGEPPAGFDHVVLTTTPGTASRLCPDLTRREHDVLQAVRYQGIVCASVVLSEPLGPYYLTYLLDDVPFTAVVEMTAFVDREQVCGNTLVYLPKYVPAGDPLFDVPDDELRHRFLDALARISPTFRPEHVRAFAVSRVREVFPIPVLDYSLHVPPSTTTVPGLHLVTSAQIVNGTLNVNETVLLAEEAARRLGALPGYDHATQGGIR